MMRQPDFVTPDFANEALERTKNGFKISFSGIGQTVHGFVSYKYKVGNNAKKHPQIKFPYWELLNIFASCFKINGKNICKKHIKRILGEVPGHRAIFENMV